MILLSLRKGENYVYSNSKRLCEGLVLIRKAFLASTVLEVVTYGCLKSVEWRIRRTGSHRG